MNIDSIRKLRKKFIFISMVSIAVVMFVLAILINGVNFASIRSEIYETLDYISDNGGTIPQSTPATITPGNDSPEFRYQTRYFSVVLDSEGNETSANTDSIAAVDETEAVQYARLVYRRFFNFGAYGDYYYEVTKQSDGSYLVVFLDCAIRIHSYYRLLYGSLFICLGGLLIIFLFIYFLSNRIIQPEIENVEKQKQFITNASHELKTPLAVIRANTEISEMTAGKTEWTESTLKQVDRLDELVKNLVTLSRANEQADTGLITDLNVSKAISDVCETMRPVAEQQKKELDKEVQENVIMHTDENAIRQLTRLLLDNAIKYCDDGGKIIVAFWKKGKTMHLVISNSYAEGKDTDFSRFFERFYRKDESHNVSKGGYGIGLSIAQNIVTRFRGKISASWKNGYISFTCTMYGL